MTEYLHHYTWIILLSSELILIPIFWMLNKLMNVSNKRLDVGSVFKGILERFVLFVGLLSGFPQILILFGALKVGTIIGDAQKVSNEYYFAGNMISVLFVIICYNLVVYFSS